MQATFGSGFVVALVAAASVGHAASINLDQLPRAESQAGVKEQGVERPADFGPSSTFYTAIDGSQVHPRQNTATYERGITSGAYYCKTGTPENEAFGQFHMPHGVRFTGLRAWLYDNQATSAVNVDLESICLPDFSAAFPTVTTLATVATTNAFVAGNFSAFDSSAGTISDNQSCTYRVRVTVGTAGCPGAISLGFFKARLQWQRFIPVAPAVATFGDVPVGSQFFREVEALVASGVTSGCAVGQYCPANFVTRLQMAAFLARLAGLPAETIVDPANP